MAHKNPADQAVGSFEAAALMGVHYTRPCRMAADGLLAARVITESAYCDGLTKHPTIYDGRECDQNYLEYEEAPPVRGRPRAWLHLRPDALRRLKAIKTPIAFEDAISAAEAAKILCVHVSFVQRLIASGQIVGRAAWNPRGSANGHTMIISRKSCVENVRNAKAMAAAGGKVGRPRKIS